jgi:hypothetical protein
MAKRFLLLAVLISGRTFHYMGKGLNALVGKDVRYAFDVLGYPNGKQECGATWYVANEHLRLRNLMEPSGGATPWVLLVWNSNDKPLTKGDHI